MYHVAMERLDLRSAHGDYTAVVGPGTLNRLGDVLEPEVLDSLRSVVTDTTVGRLYGQKTAAGLSLDLVELPGGEANKRWASVEETCRR